MGEIPDIYLTSQLLADRSRIEILTSLMDNRFHTVHELAKAAKISDQTASYHLSKFLLVKWTESYRQGRYVYHRLINEEIGQLMEQLMNVSEKRATTSLHQNQTYKRLKKARTCYQHLAGNIGTFFFDFFLESGILKKEAQGFILTQSGVQFFQQLGLDIAQIQMEKGTFIRPCMDWTERKFHLAGNLGKHFLFFLIGHGYLVHDIETRALLISEEGEKFLKENFGKFE